MMSKLRNCVFFPLLAWLPPAVADFSDSSMTIHPGLPHGGPIIVEIAGTWPDGCGPGVPEVSDYTGDSVLIEFLPRDENIFCAAVVSPYRVLVDLSEVMARQPESPQIGVTARYGEAELTKTFLRSCALITPCPEARYVLPDEGLYKAEGYKNQGLLLARQGTRMVAYPLTYDESGSSEWLIGAGGMTGDAFFSKLYEATGGQCPDCAPSDTPAQLEPVGRITLLADTEGQVQVKLNDGPFVEYRPLSFGYGALEVEGDLPQITVPDFSGRWALAEVDGGKDNDGNDLPFTGLPGTFDVVFDGQYDGIGLLEGDTEYRYRLLDLEGDPFSYMGCYRSAEYSWEIQCWIGDPQVEVDYRDFVASPVSPERMQLGLAGVRPAVGVPATAVIVRVD